VLSLGDTGLTNGHLDERATVVQRGAEGGEPGLEEGVFDQVGSQTAHKISHTQISDVQDHSNIQLRMHR